VRRLALLFALGLLVTGRVPSAQTIVSGRVVDDETGRAIPNARVSLIADSWNDRPVALTDPDGRFLFDVPPRRYRINASKTRYAQHEITFGDAGQPVEIRLPRAAAIFGRVVDDVGEPVIAARVTAETLSGAVAAASETDDRGEYRLGSLRPDTFVVAVATTGPMVRQVVAANQVVSMPSNFKSCYPAARTVKEAERLLLRPGDERGGIDLMVPFSRSGNQPFSVLPRAADAVRGGCDLAACDRKAHRGYPRTNRRYRWCSAAECARQALERRQPRCSTHRQVRLQWSV
jgi:carboxypeptidase family protein